MADSIQALFVTPALAFARLGGSSTPQFAYDWIDTRAPRADGETSIAPAWTIAVQPDGSPAPFMPDSVTFRDGDLIRPVAPFYEIWARIGDAGDPPANWRDVPLTPALLQANGLALAALQIKVTAQNLKAARRTSNKQLAFGTFPPLAVSATNNARIPILGTSPTTATNPMIPVGRSIPLGSIQILRSVPQPGNEPWSDSVNVETLRFRYMPATGLFYGPPEAAQALPQNGRPAPAVRPENAFLNRNAGWRGTSTNDLVEPGDTYDVINQRQSPVQGQPAGRGPSLGVVDDTCEVHFEVSLQRGAALPPLTAKSVAFVGPPDFAPDRRPFLSTADELNDREADAAARNNNLDDAALDRWVQDLFERIYETVSLFNVDFNRREIQVGGHGATLPPGKLRANDIDGGARDRPTGAMGGRDALRNPLFKLPAPTTVDPLPLSAHARMRHRALSDLQSLIELVSLDQNRLRTLVRPPFEVEDFESPSTPATSMRMPPFMRQSNAQPLTLANWQYDLLMRWVDRTVQRAQLQGAAFAQPAGQPPPRKLSGSAAARRANVLARINAAAGTP
ncbi:hypothetical protein JQ604_25445 [Bradyrhizobium jicamae]|uniref:hypothetical protein n=1 Tax=Bradyrhizobium jicamae TaxID=280332 RepID=UPI001BA54E2B|nr:hypothetical protein [Bradyrhizobium jicamae]MBR0755539.1 hypothetical protein [Bradyrhizobium jicamae]